jgi:aspartyl-tRNA(Asn)/glutamyl-tRNA(Gln) amidotransferase subunit B
MVRGELMRELHESGTALSACRITPADLAELVRAKESGKISSSQQKRVFHELWKGAALAELLRAEGEQVSDLGVLEPIVDQVLEKNAGEVEKYKQGNTKLLAFFVGQVMRATRGKANPALVTQLLERKIGGAS